MASDYVIGPLDENNCRVTHLCCVDMRLYWKCGHNELPQPCSLIEATLLITIEVTMDLTLHSQCSSATMNW